MDWVFVSPHYDDAVFSCGGLIWGLVQRGDTVGVWTTASAAPPPTLSPFAASLHARWNFGSDSAEARAAEDARACQRLGAQPRPLGLADCIYRRHPHTGAWLYAAEEAIFGPVDQAEADRAAALSTTLSALAAPGVQWVGPLTVGGHVDHRLTRQAFDQLPPPRAYYADVPYILRRPLDAPLPEAAGLKLTVIPLSTAALTAWGDACAAYASQLPDFWPSEAAMRAALMEFAAIWGGQPLWRAENGAF